MQKQTLPSEWTLITCGAAAEAPESIRGRAIKATVPGCVHTDLIAAGLLDDPYFDRNELKQTWVGKTDWRYSCTFTASASLLAHERVDLVCEGLDTIARIELNGKVVGDTANMHHPHRFNVKPFLLAGREALLTITFSSPLAYAETMEKKMGTLPHVEKHPFNFIRKMACNFGWDWGPALITAGIWQPIYLEAWSDVRIVEVRPMVTVTNDKRAEVDVAFEVEYATSSLSYDVQIQVEFSNVRQSLRSIVLKNGQSKGIVKLQIDNPELWWPRGHGKQQMYELDVLIFPYDRGVIDEEDRAFGQGIDRWTKKIGLRTVRLNTDKDEIGSKFQIEINGKPIYCKGANWIPDDCFLNRVDEKRYRQRIQQAADANMNMLRIWGGGIYETETFYSLCDEFGIMVWQDFLFACAAYPEEEPFKQLVEAEARHNIARLSSHPSHVIWNGCNENIWGYFDWGWKQKIGTRTWGLGYYLDLLPKLIEELDTSRPYWPASPYSGSMEIPPLDDKHGNKHVWDAWNQKDYTVYRNYTPRFCSEFGHQAPPTNATLRDSIPSRQLEPASAAMLHHQKANGGNDKLHGRLTEHFEIPAKFDDWLYVTQLNQARAVQTGVEWFRSRAPACMGALYWQHNDCWPVTSWAGVDGMGRKKPLWYATRQFYADRLLTLQPEADGSLGLFAINDSDDVWQGVVQHGRLKLNGRAGANTLPSGESTTIPPRSVKKLYSCSAASSDEFIVAHFGTARAYWYFDIDKNLNYPKPEFDGEVTRDGTCYNVKITAKTLLRDVALFVDRLDPQSEASEQLVTLLPGDAHTFHFNSSRSFSREAILLPPVFQCANYFGRVN